MCISAKYSVGHNVYETKGIICAIIVTAISQRKPDLRTRGSPTGKCV